MGQLGQFPLEQWFFEMPPCTRYWTTATVVTSILLQCKVITPFQLFYSWRAVYYKSQVCTYIFLLLHSANFPSVLAVSDHLHILRAAFAGSRLPRVLSPAIFAAIGARIRSFTCCLLLAFALCMHLAACPEFADHFDSVPGFGALKHSCLHLVQEKPRHPSQFPWCPRLHSPVPSMGFNGFPHVHARQHSEG